MSSRSRISWAIRWPVAPVPRTSIESRSGSQAATLVRPASRSSSTSRPGISRISRGSRARVSSVPASSSCRGRGEPPGGVERGGQQRVRAGRLDQGDRTVDHVLVDPAAVAEVEDGRLGQAADDLVGAGEDEVGAAAQGALRQRRRGSRGGSPRPRRRPAGRRGRGRPRRAPRREPPRRSRSGRRASPRAPPALRQSGVERLRGDAVGDAELWSISGATKLGRRPERTSPSMIEEWTLRWTTTRPRSAGP